jgi:hypothetical protein
MSLTDEDHLRLSLCFIRLFRAMEQQYLHIRLGNLDGTYFISIQKSFLEFLAFPGVQEWWRLSSDTFEDSFCEEVERDIVKASNQKPSSSFEAIDAPT